MYDAYYLLVVIGLFAGGEVLSALGPFHFHVSPRCWRWFGVWLWVLVFVAFYISYDDSSHSEWALDFLLRRSTTGVACFTPS